MENRIKPEQYIAYPLETPSGNIIVKDGENFFELFLSENLTGDLSLTGSLNIDGRKVYSPNNNNLIGDGNWIFGGENNFITGTDNLIINGFASEVSGSKNILIGSDSIIADSDFSFAFGNNVVITETGSVVFGDSSFITKGSNGTDSFTINFTGGLFIEHETFMNADVFVTGGNLNTTRNLHVKQNAYITGDAFVNGNLGITGDLDTNSLEIRGHATNSGINLVNSEMLSDSSGHLIEHTLIQNSGISGDMLAMHAAIPYKSGDWTISGNWRFLNDIELKSGEGLLSKGGLNIKDSGYNVLVEFNDEETQFNNPINMNRSAPQSWNSNGNKGQMSWDDEYIYICTGWRGGTDNSGWARLPIGGWN